MYRAEDSAEEDHMGDESDDADSDVMEGSVPGSLIPLLPVVDIV